MKVTKKIAQNRSFLAQNSPFSAIFSPFFTGFITMRPLRKIHIYETPKRFSIFSKTGFILMKPKMTIFGHFCTSFLKTKEG